MPFEVRDNHLFSGGFYHQDAPAYAGPSRIEDDVRFQSPSNEGKLRLNNDFRATGSVDFGGYSVEALRTVTARAITGAFNLTAERITTEGDISIDGVLRVTHLKAGGTVTCDHLELAKGGTVEGTVIERHPRPSNAL